jgi:capsule polysaccharide export protein KpsE/RkpR
VEKTTSLGDGETGHDNEDAENRGEDGAGDLIKKVGKTVESARIKALRHQLKAARHQLHQQETVHASAIAKLNKKMSKLTNQVTAASAQIGRRSVSPEISAMLAKSNIDASDLLRTGTRMSVAEVDGILAGSGLNLNAQDRMAMKNAFLRSGLMEDGRVERGTSR